MAGVSGSAAAEEGSHDACEDNDGLTTARREAEPLPVCSKGTAQLRRLIKFGRGQRLSHGNRESSGDASLVVTVLFIVLLASALTSRSSKGSREELGVGDCVNVGGCDLLDVRVADDVSDNVIGCVREPLTLAVEDPL